MSSNNCIICDEKTPLSKVTSCPYCDFKSCRTCVRKYVLNETETKCMNCKKTWTRAHQNTILLPTFVNSELRSHQEQVLYEREMALFPTTIDVIEDRRVVYGLTSEYRMNQEKTTLFMANMRYRNSVINENRRRISLHKSAPKMYSDINIDELTNQNHQLRIQSDSEHLESERIQMRERVIRRLLTMTTEDRKIVMANHIDGADPAEILETLRRTGQMDEASKRARAQFIRACPVESCRGFLSQQWKCGLCNVFTCSKCNVPKCNVPKSNSNQADAPSENNHVCNPDDVATAELLAKDTKPCPQCGTGIFKIDGCDQMWCTECRTAFNWRTGNLETGHVHNPHYFEYQRRMGADVRNILDMPCNALAPDQYHGVINHLIQIATNQFSYNPTEREKRGLKPLLKDVRQQLNIRSIDYAITIHHLAEIVLPRYRPDAIQDNLELRVQYLTEQITKDSFKSALSREAKQFNRKIEIGQVVQTVVFGMSDILTRLVTYLRTDYNREANTNYCDPDQIFAMFSEIDALVNYANECLEFISKQYKMTRVAIFVRNISRKYQPGLYSVRVLEGIDGLTQVRPM